MRYCPTCGRRLEDVLQFCPDDGARTEVLPESESSEPVDKLLNRTIDGRYRIEKKIGEGGMGNVYLATHVVLNRKLALKVLAGDMAKNPEVVQRFQQEAQAATSIGHQNIIDIVDFGALPDGTAYFVMEYLDGMSLTSLVERQQALDVSLIARIIKQMAGALGAAHARGIVHRDLKPDNVFVITRGDDDRFVKVLDFGIAKVGGAASKLTQTGVIFGTPHYMAPEQAAGQAVDHRADIYSLGIMLYEMCIGKVPFDADTYMAILSKHMFEEPPVDPTVVEGRELGPYRAVVLKCLAKKPEDRYQSMHDLMADVEVIAQGGVPKIDIAAVGARRTGSHDIEELPVRSRKPKAAAWIAGAGVVLGLLAVWLFVASGDEDESVAPDAAADAANEPAAPSTPPPAAATLPIAPPTPGEPTRVATVSSTPVGAEVFRATAFLGVTPLPLRCPGSKDSTRLVLKLDGYEDRIVEIDGSFCSDKTFPMKKARVPKVKAPAKPKTTPTTTKRGTDDVVNPWQ